MPRRRSFAVAIKNKLSASNFCQREPGKIAEKPVKASAVFTCRAILSWNFVNNDHLTPQNFVCYKHATTIRSGFMRCPKCGCQEDKVIDSRASREGATIRRRRQCLGCGHRFTTYEGVERDELMVIKRDGRREEFSRDKLLSGLKKAFQKRPISPQVIEDLLER